MKTRYMLIGAIVIVLSLIFINTTRASDEYTLLIGKDAIPAQCTFNGTTNLTHESPGIISQSNKELNAFDKGIQSLAFCPEGSMINIIYKYADSSTASENFDRLYSYIVENNDSENLYPKISAGNGYMIKIKHPEYGFLFYYIENRDNLNIILVADTVDDTSGELFFNTLKDNYTK